MKVFSSLLFCLLYIHVSAQHFTCIHDDIQKHQMAIDPNYEQNRENLELLIKNFTDNNSNNARRAAIACQKDTNYFEIPVVVHVMHLGEPIGLGSNTSDANIQIGLDDANALFTRDLGIKLILAKRDPNGQATNSIKRVDCSHLTNYVNYGVVPNGYSPVSGGVHDTIIKNLSRWPVQDYVNIYIVAKIDYPGASGYSSFPGMNSKTQGVVCRTSAYNSINLAHELGHFFNLAHTFDGSSDTQCAPDDGSFGDRVTDTPPIRKNDCGATSSCGNYPNVNNSIMNVMGYCAKPNSFFTPGQRERVKASLYSNNQWSLLKSVGLVASNISGEVAIDSIKFVENITQPICGGVVTSKFLLTNYGGTITSVELQINFDDKDTSIILPVGGAGGVGRGAKKWINLPYSYTLTYPDEQHSIKLLIKNIFLNNTQLTEQNYFNNSTCLNNILLQRAPEFTISSSVSPVEYAQIVGDSLVCQNKKATLSLINIKEGCVQFNGWFVNGTKVENSGFTYSFFPSMNSTVQARFDDIKYPYRIRTLDTLLGKVVVDNITYNSTQGWVISCPEYPETKIGIARPKQGGKFLYWTEDKTGNPIVSTDSIFSFSILKNSFYTAHFEPAIPTGIVNNSSLSEVSIYPNPTSHNLHINFNSPKANNISLLITDMKGSTIERKNISSTKGLQNILVDVSQYAKGSYILHLQDEEGIGSYSFIVQ